MGRQIALVASPADEQLLLAFLREAGPIQLCNRGAETAADLWLTDFPLLDLTRPRYQYFIWNQAFRWTPKLVQQTPAGGGFIENLDSGPVIEFDRSAMHVFTVDRGICLGGGRIYWGQRNRHKGFEAWYERVAGWVRRTGENLSTCGPACYCLPDALRIWQKRQAESGSAANRGGIKRSRGSTSPRRGG